LWSEKQPVKVQSRSIARIDRRFTQLRAHLRASTQEQCAPNTGARPKEVLFLKSSILGILCLVGGDNSHQGKPFTTRTAPSKVRMARGNAIKMPIQAASATHRDRKPLAAIELQGTLLREEEEKGEMSSTPSQRAGRHHGRDHHLRLAAYLDGGAKRLGAEGQGV
jgi:hypothetical protein